MTSTYVPANILSWRSSVPTVPIPVPDAPAPAPPSESGAVGSALYAFHHHQHHHLHSNHSSSSVSLSTACSTEEDDREPGSEAGEQRARPGRKHEAERLVDSTLDLLSTSWPSTSSFSSRSSSISFESHPSDVDRLESESDQDAVPLRTFVHEILRRSRSSCATLRAAHWYLERASALLPPQESRACTLACPRRTFLSSLILANKFLHDKVYSNRAWGKVSGLEVTEISQGETALGDLLQWKLWVGRKPSEASCIRDELYGHHAPALIPIDGGHSTSLSPLRQTLSEHATVSSSIDASHIPHLGRSRSLEPASTTAGVALRPSVVLRATAFSAPTSGFASPSLSSSSSSSSLLVSGRAGQRVSRRLHPAPLSSFSQLSVSDGLLLQEPSTGRRGVVSLSEEMAAPPAVGATALPEVSSHPVISRGSTPNSLSAVESTPYAEGSPSGFSSSSSSLSNSPATFSTQPAELDLALVAGESEGESEDGTTAAALLELSSGLFELSTARGGGGASDGGRPHLLGGDDDNGAAQSRKRGCPFWAEQGREGKAKTMKTRRVALQVAA